MKKSRLFSLFTTLLTGSVIASSTIAFFNNQNLNISKVVNNTQANQYTSSVNEDNLDAASVSFIQDTSQNKTSTPYGFLKYDSDKNAIYSISYFGFIGWKYNLADSAFLKRGGINKPTNLYMYYVADLDRIVVYGEGSNKSFLFQLNAKDGSEYYVNDGDKNAQGSSLIKDYDTNIIANLGQISYMGDKTIVLLPKEMSKTNKTINTYKINLDSYIGSPLVFDYSDFGFSTSTEGQPQATTNYEVKNIIGYVDTGTKNILLVNAIATTGGIKTAGVLSVIFDEDLKFSQAAYISFLNSDDINGKDNNEIFTKSFYDYTIEKDESNKISRIFIIMKEIKALDSFSSYNVGALQLSGSKKRTLTSNENINNQILLDNIQNKSIVNDIFYNNKDKKTYVLVRDDVGNGKNAYGFYDATKIGTHAFTYPIKITFESDNTNNFAIKPIIYNFNLSSSEENIPFIYSYNSFSTAGTWTKQNIGSLKITTGGDENNFTASFGNDFVPTKISSFKEKIEKEHSYYLPQDINQEILNKYIYLQKVDNDSKLYNSTVVIPQNGLKPNNEAGTLTGTVNLNLTKWWLYGASSNNIESIPVNINLSNLGTNAGLNFAIVLNANINETKYNKILEFQKTKYPSQITDQEILDNFLEYGNKITLAISDIKFVREGKVVGDNGGSTYVETSTSEDKAITVTTNDDNGTVKIDYNLNGKTSPSALNKIGTGTFTNFKQLNTWQKITWNEAKLLNLKKSKMIFQITLKDIIDCLNLSSSYSRDESKWKWVPTNSETNKKSQYIDDNLKGILSGTISYDRQSGGTPDSVDQSFTTLTIGESDQGQGFIKLVDSIGGTNDKSVLYNQEKATQVASIYSASEAQSKVLEIFGQSITFFNNWTDVSSLDLGNPSVSNNTLTYNIQFSSSKITTNFEKANQEKLVLDSDWISAINASSDVLKFDRSFSFNFNQTTYEWNYGIPITDTQYGIGDIKVTTNSIITGNDLDHFKSLTPTIFTNIYKDDSNGSYLSFQDRFNLLKVNPNIDSSSIDYFVIKDIQLVPNDEKGTVYVQYEINYPNISNTSLGGETVFPQITLTGFKTLNDQIHQYLIWIIIMAVIIIVMGSSFGGYVLYNKKKNHKDKEKYNRSKKRISLQEAQTHVNDFNPLKKSKGLRNTLHSHTLKNAKIRQYEQAMKDYKQKIKDIDEMDKSKRKK